MRSEKGITLVALIGLFVLIVVLAGISIAMAAKGTDETQEPINTEITDVVDEYKDEEIVVDPTVKSSIIKSIGDESTEETNNTIANEVE